MVKKELREWGFGFDLGWYKFVLVRSIYNYFRVYRGLQYISSFLLEKGFCVSFIEIQWRWGTWRFIRGSADLIERLFIFQFIICQFVFIPSQKKEKRHKDVLKMSYRMFQKKKWYHFDFSLFRNGERYKPLLLGVNSIYTGKLFWA